MKPLFDILQEKAKPVFESLQKKSKLQINTLNQNTKPLRSLEVNKKHAFAVVAILILGLVIFGYHYLGKIKTTATDSNSVSSQSGSQHQSAESLIRNYAKSKYGSGADVSVDAMGGAYQVMVRTRVVGGQYDGGINEATYTATVNTSSQEITSWELVSHN